MEHSSHFEGGRSSSHPERNGDSTTGEQEGHNPAPRLGQTSESGARLNAYAALSALHTHAVAVSEHPERADTPASHLTELALSSAVVDAWSRRQPLMMHRALVAGASIADVAAATNMSLFEAYHTWETWAEWHAFDLFPDQPLLDPQQVGDLKARLRLDYLT